MISRSEIFKPDEGGNFIHRKLRQLTGDVNTANFVNNKKLGHVYPIVMYQSGVFTKNQLTQENAHISIHYNLDANDQSIINARLGVLIDSRNSSVYWYDYNERNVYIIQPETFIDGATAFRNVLPEFVVTYPVNIVVGVILGNEAGRFTEISNNDLMYASESYAETGDTADIKQKIANPLLQEYSGNTAAPVLAVAHITSNASPDRNSNMHAFNFTPQMREDIQKIKKTIGSLPRGDESNRIELPSRRPQIYALQRKDERIH